MSMLNLVWTDTGLDFQKADRVFGYGGVLACGGPSLTEKAHCRFRRARPECCLRSGNRKRSRWSRVPTRLLSVPATSMLVATAGSARETSRREYTSRGRNVEADPMIGS